MKTLLVSLLLVSTTACASKERKVDDITIWGDPSKLAKISPEGVVTLEPGVKPEEVIKAAVAAYQKLIVECRPLAISEKGRASAPAEKQEAPKKRLPPK